MTCTGGRLHPVLMRHPPPPLSVKTWGGGWGGSLGGGVLAGGCWGGLFGRGVPKVGGPARDPLLPHAYLQGGCVSGDLGARRCVCDNSAFSSLPGRKSEGSMMKGKHAQKNLSAVGAMAPTPLPLKTWGGGGLGGVLHKRTGPGRSPVMAWPADLKGCWGRHRAPPPPRALLERRGGGGEGVQRGGVPPLNEN